MGGAGEEIKYVSKVWNILKGGKSMLKEQVGEESGGEEGVYLTDGCVSQNRHTLPEDRVSSLCCLPPYPSVYH